VSGPQWEVLQRLSPLGKGGYECIITQVPATLTESVKIQIVADPNPRA